MCGPRRRVGYDLWHMVKLAWLAAALAGLACAEGVDWPSFRGPDASGVSEGYSTPVEWDIASGQNIRWQTPIAGLGHSSPVVWGDRLFVATAVSGKPKDELRVGLYGDIASVEDDSEHEWRVLCLDKNSGEILWQETVRRAAPLIKRHTKATHANSTVATDGDRVVAFFGSEGLYCFDMDGKLLWKRDLGRLDSGYFRVPEAQWGFGSSPILADGRVIIQCDVQEGSFLSAIDLQDGGDVWRTPRQDVPTWSTPAVHRIDGREQIVVNGWKHIGGYDLGSGKELWKMEGGGDIPVPTPIFGDGLIFITNAHGSMSPVYAVRPDATGDLSLAEGELSNRGIAWSVRTGGGYMQTPIYYRGNLYVSRNNGVLTCFRAKDGEQLYQARLGQGRTGFTASPVAADGKIYFADEFGDVSVLEAGDSYRLLATNSLDDIVMATPAISEGVLFFRTPGKIIAVGE